MRNIYNQTVGNLQNLVEGVNEGMLDGHAQWYAVGSGSTYYYFDGQVGDWGVQPGF